VVEIEVNQVFQKNSNRKKTAVKAKYTPRKPVKVKGLTIASRLRTALTDPIVNFLFHLFSLFSSILMIFIIIFSSSLDQDHHSPWPLCVPRGPRI